MTFFGVACDMTLWISNVSDNPTGGNQIFLELAILYCVNNVFVDMSVRGANQCKMDIYIIYIYIQVVLHIAMSVNSLDFTS